MKKDKKQEELPTSEDPGKFDIEDIVSKNKRIVVKEWIRLLTDYLTGRNGNKEVNLIVLKPMLEETAKSIDIYFKEDKKDEGSKQN